MTSIKRGEAFACVASAPLLAAALLACVACSGGASPAPTEPAPTAAMKRGAPPTSAAQAAQSAAARGEPSAAPGAAKPTEPPRESPFFVAYEQPDRGLVIYPMGPIAIAVSGQGYMTSMLRIDAKTVREDEGIYKGLPGHTKPDEDRQYMSIGGVRGQWPKQGHIDLNLPGDRGGTDVEYTLSNGAWSILPDPHPEAYYKAYYQGTLGLRAAWRGAPLYVVRDDKGNAHFLRDSRKPGALVPTIADAPKGFPCPKRVYRFIALAALETGEVYGMGQACVEGDRKQADWQDTPSKGPIAVERWAAGSRASTLAVLPGQGGLVRAEGTYTSKADEVDARSPSDIYASTSVSPDGSEAGVRPYIAYYNGTSWAEVDHPAKGWLRSLSVREGDCMLWAQVGDDLFRRPALHTGKGGSWERMTPEGKKDLKQWEISPDGALWVRYGEELFRRPLERDAWEQIPLPSRSPSGEPAVYVPSQIVFWGSEVIIVSDIEDDGTRTKSAAILRSSKPEAVLYAPKREKAPSALAKAATPACKNVFVVLYKLAKTAPADFDFPLTRSALKGHRELEKAEFAETVEAGRRYLVAFVPTFEMGQGLLKLVAEKVKGSAPQLMCGEPVVSRKLTIDLTTGEMVR